ncbi:MAG: hypothetical protein VB877_01805 [Pirellulaceae bacterium]
MPTHFTKLQRPRRARQRATRLLLGLLLLCPLAAIGGEFTFETPEGALFDCRTYYYDAIRKQVIKRPQFVGLYGQEKRDAYAAVGVRTGPRDVELWKETRDTWKEELATRHHRRFIIAQEKANRRRGVVTPNENDSYVAWITLPDGTRILMVRNLPSSSSQQLDPNDLFNAN